MKGIVLVNGEIQSLEQQKCLDNWLVQANIQPLKLNRFQLHFYYSIPHALLHDLQQADVYADCLVIDSAASVQRFIRIYPEKWVLLTSYFQHVTFLQEEIVERTS